MGRPSLRALNAIWLVLAGQGLVGFEGGHAVIIQRASFLWDDRLLRASRLLLAGLPAQWRRPFGLTVSRRHEALRTW
jgi:hypothetical protein